MVPIDALIRDAVGPEPIFDPVAREFLVNNAAELRGRSGFSSLLEAVDLGTSVPWLWRLTFATRGLGRDEHGGIVPVHQHTVVVRLAPDYLRRADRFEVLTLLEPARPFHPNLKGRHVCLEVYPGEPLVEICEALHALFSWRLRQLSEPDALDPEACVWGRAHLDELPLDDRPLFGRTLSFDLERVEVA